MDIRPILSTLRRHKTASALIVLEIALSCAIVCNALFLISGRIDRMDRETGIVNEEIVRINTSRIGQSGDVAAQVKADVAALRAIPGVKAATAINHVPFDKSSWNSSMSHKPDQPIPTLNAGVYLGDEQLIKTLGLKIIAGRGFLPEEFIDMSTAKPGDGIAAVILTKTVAEKLFPGQPAVGKLVYDLWGGKPIKVVGVVESLIRPNDNGGPAEVQYSVLLPIVPSESGRFAIRTSPERRAEVQKAAIAALNRNDAKRVINDEAPFTDVMQEYYRQDRAMAWLLVSICVALMAITALGIVGLASFWVQQRTKQIGVRRALGATRGQILRYFQVENFLLATLGIVLGMLGAYGLNQLLMTHYELPRLPAYYLPIGAVTLWLLGQIAVFGPARRAAAVPPAVATRSV
jgi:putative ABC transport system permease protein